MIKKLFLDTTEEQINSVANQPILVEAEGVKGVEGVERVEGAEGAEGVEGAERVEGAEGVKFVVQIIKIHLSKGMNIKDRFMSP